MRKHRPVHRIDDQEDLRRIRDEDPNFSGTLAKGLMILQSFVKDPRAHANSEFAERLGLPRPTVSRLCRSLQALGFLDHDDRLDRYFIGPAAVTLGYPYVINTPLLSQLRPAMQSMADRFEGAVSVGVVMDLDVVYVETCAHEHGTLKRPGVGAVRGIVETAMGRAWLARLTVAERNRFLARARQDRADEYTRSTEGLKDSLANYGKRGFSINMGDAGLGVLAVGVASNIRYGPRNLLFNCAVPGYRAKPADLMKTIGPTLVQLVNMADRQVGLR
ncbi:MAG TPA: helix-turn-helix domain-containing protein [Ramlibacter sp.]|uniref:IclR family transcriptional regulator n=1 Tax=Ramlibacter sp. TaxID=1917967 RepID=UPI002C715DE0|nr:helix-turn-helix domain-containing protein [Ramlibacter sp.]HVZ45928.1 helix-turn-helix domain-containing protein [Ramlibacter sp.]